MKHQIYGHYPELQLQDLLLFSRFVSNPLSFIFNFYLFFFIILLYVYYNVTSYNDLFSYYTFVGLSYVFIYIFVFTFQSNFPSPISSLTSLLPSLLLHCFSSDIGGPLLDISKPCILSLSEYKYPLSY